MTDVLRRRSCETRKRHKTLCEDGAEMGMFCLPAKKYLNPQQPPEAKRDIGQFFSVALAGIIYQNIDFRLRAS